MDFLRRSLDQRRSSRQGRPIAALVERLEQRSLLTSPLSALSVLSATGTPFNASEGALFLGIVAHFQDTLPLTVASNYTATIDWGDGTATSTGTISVNSGGGFDVYGSHIYNQEGVFPTQIAIRSILTGQQIVAVGQASVSPPLPYVPVSQFIVTPAGQSFTGAVATFTDANPGDTVSDFTALVDWGNGQTTQGSISETNGTFAINGTMTYTVPGTYTITVTIADQQGNTFSVASTANVVNGSSSGTSLFSFTGTLANVIGNGPHAASGFTNTNRPTFSGTSTPFAIVQLYGRHFNADTEVPLGQAVATSSGQWTFTSGPLAVGTWIITATATPPGGYPGYAMTLSNQNGGDLVYIDLTPRLVRWLSHGQKSVPHLKMSKPPKVRHHKA